MDLHVHAHAKGGQRQVWGGMHVSSFLTVGAQATKQHQKDNNTPVCLQTQEHKNKEEQQRNTAEKRKTSVLRDRIASNVNAQKWR